MRSRREVRRDPTTGDEVALAEERGLEQRPRTAPHAVTEESCPFCPGHEQHTRPTIAAIERDGAWVARAFANRRPVLVVEEALSSQSGAGGLFESLSGTGAHEVLVEAPEHRPLHHLPVQRTVDALHLAVQRLQDLRRDMRLQTLQWFRNHGVGAGASQPHPHAQIVGLPLVPRRVAAWAERSRAWLARHGRPLMRDLREAEGEAGRLIFEEGPIAAFCPFAPRHPFEVWLVPAGAGPHLADASASEVAHLAQALHTLLNTFERAIGETPFSVVAFGAPASGPVDGLTWHLRLAPRLLVGAGLEEATGMAAHSVFPEEAAQLLRLSLNRSRH